MKSEHRHDLHTNELGRVTEKVAQSLGGFFETYGNRIMIAVCTASVVAAGLIYYIRTSKFREANAWNELSTALSSSRKESDFADIAERYSGTSAAHWAKLQEAEARLAQGIQYMFTNREAALLDLEKSRKELEKLVADRGLKSELRERALFALARCQETMSRGDTAEAVATYEKVLKEFPNSIYKQLADERIAGLKSGGAQEFYAWFSKQNPKPAPARKPADRGAAEEGIEGDLLKSLSPSLNFPKLGTKGGPHPELPGPALKAPGASEKPAEKPADKDEPKAKDAAPKAEEKPAASKDDSPAPAKEGDKKPTPSP